MANQINTQIIQDGERNVIFKVVGLLDTSNVSLTTLLDPATLSSVNATGLNSQKATKLAIKKVTFDIEDGLAVNLYWDATTDVPIWRFTGRDKMNATFTSNLPNDAGAGVTGKILYDTDGWASGTMSYTLLIECIKQWT